MIEMTMRNDNEIINSLECCMGCNCGGCDYNNRVADECKDALIYDALMLINRLKRKLNKGKDDEQN